MRIMIAVVYYGSGNILSVTKALEHAGARVLIAREAEDIKKADKIVLPGVGAFGKAVEMLKEKNLMEPIAKAVSRGKPLLGICLGLHLLFSESEESPRVKGLSLLKGKVEKFTQNVKIPHLGWNRVYQKTSSSLWKEIPDGTYFYFAHSYISKPLENGIITGITEYGSSFTSALGKENLFGVQFHPEKSQKWGVKLLENFVKL